MARALGFEWQVAVRFLREGRMQSLLIVVGVAAGVAVVTYISALISGLQRNTLDETLGAQSHLTIYAPDDVVAPAAPVDAGATVISSTQARAQRLRSIGDWQPLQAAVERTPGVSAVSPMVAGSALAQRGEASRAVALAGIELERYDRIVRLRSKVVAGQARLAPGDAILGRELATDLGLRVGDRLNLSLGNLSEPVLVTALVDLGIRDLNRRTVFVSLRAAQSLLGLPGGATRLDVTVDDVWQAQAITDQLRSRFPVRVESWQEANAQLVSALNAQSISTGIIRAVVMIVVVLGIASVLVVSVVQKQREIGILRAMGATRGQVVRVFLLQGALVGASGSVIGAVLAALMVAAFTTLVRGTDGLPLFPITLSASLALGVAALATLCGVVAAIAPARRAAALDPAQAIRL